MFLKGINFVFIDTKSKMISTSSDVLKVLIPKRKYLPASTDILVHKNAALTLFKSSPSPTPHTQELIILPSTSEKNGVISSNNLPSLTIQLKHEQLENHCRKLQRLLKKKKLTISLLKKEHDKLLLVKNKKSPKEFLESFIFQSENSKHLVSMQINHELRVPWTSEEKNLSLSLYEKSPTFYEYMIQNNIILLHLKTIRH